MLSGADRKEVSALHFDAERGMLGYMPSGESQIESPVEYGVDHAREDSSIVTQLVLGVNLVYGCPIARSRTETKNISGRASISPAACSKSSAIVSRVR